MALFFLLFNKDCYYLSDYITGILLSAIFSFIAFVFLSMFFSLIIAPTKPVLVSIEERRIFSLERTSELGGSFVLGSGYVDTKKYYYYYAASGESDGAIKLYQSPLDKTSILLGNDNPALIQEHTYRRSSRFGLQLIDFLAGDRTQYKFFVPKNTVVLDFKP